MRAWNGTWDGKDGQTSEGRRRRKGEDKFGRRRERERKEERKGRIDQPYNAQLEDLSTSRPCVRPAPATERSCVFLSSL